MNPNKNHVCPVDKRQFATKAALEQHRVASHGGSVARGRGRGRGRGNRGSAGRIGGRGGALTAPAALGMTAMVRGGASTRSSSVDVMSVTSVKVTAKAGTVLAHLVISPRAFEGTRMSQMASLWSRWRPVNLEFVVQTTLPTIAGGQITAAWAADDSEMLPSNTIALIRRLGVMRPCVIAHGWEVIRLRVTAEAVQKWLYTDLTQDDSRHGCLWVVLTGTTAVSQGEFQCTVQANWTLDFEGPDMPVAAEHEDVVADDGYYPYFTTGTSHLTITDRLTAEENSAGGYGSIVRFSAAQPDQVYVPQQDLKYYDAAGAEKKVGAAVRMKEVTDPFFWFFADTQHAAEYVKSGAASYILPYSKAGPWTKDPANPVFRRSSQLTILFSNMGGRFKLAEQPYLPAVRDKAATKAISTLQGVIKTEAGLRPRGTFDDPVKVFSEDPILSSSVGSVASSFADLGLRGEVGGSSSFD